MRYLALALALAAVSWGRAEAQPQDVLFQADFEGNVCGFVTIDPAAELTAVHDPDLALAGEGALQLQYVQAPGHPELPGWGLPGALVLPLLDGLPGLTEVSFGLATALSTPVTVMLVEGDDGPRYTALLWSAAGTWQEYSLRLDDFYPDRDGPADPNGRLDPERVTGLAIIDADGFIRAIEATVPLFATEDFAEQTLWLDQLVLRAGEPPEPVAAEGPMVLAHYVPPMRGFLVVGGLDKTIEAEEQEDGQTALRIDYSTPAQTLVAVIHTLAPEALADARADSFQVRSNQASTLLVALEERRGPGDINKSSYHAMVSIEPGEQFETITLPLSEFKLGEDQTDPDGALNPELVNTLLIIDGSAMLGDAEVINTLRLRPPLVIP